MEIDQSWRDKPITRKQAKFLRDLACKSFSQLTRGEASDMIQRWHEDNPSNMDWYDNDVLEDSK